MTSAIQPTANAKQENLLLRTGDCGLIGFLYCLQPRTKLDSETFARIPDDSQLPDPNVFYVNFGIVDHAGLALAAFRQLERSRRSL